MDDFDFIPSFVPAPSTSTAAPKIGGYELPDRKRAGRPNARPSARPAPERKVSLKTVAIVFALGVLILGMLSSKIYLDKKIVKNNRTIANLTEEIDQAKAENVRLTAALSCVISSEKVQDYATNVLGMQKAERYQIHYFDDRDGDKVVIAGGKALNADAQK